MAARLGHARFPQQGAVGGQHVGVADHDLRGGEPPGRLDAAATAIFHHDAPDPLPQPEFDAQFPADPFQCTRQGHDAALERIAAEGVLHVRNDLHRGRRAKRAGAVVGGIAVEQLHRPRIGKGARVRVMQGREGGQPGGIPDRAQPRARQVGSRFVEAARQEQLAGRGPHPGAAGKIGVQFGPRRHAGPGQFGGKGRAVGIAAQARAVGEFVGAQRRERHRLKVVPQVPAQPGEKAAENLRQGEQRRPGVEPESAQLPGGRLAARVCSLVENRHLPAGLRQQGRRRQSADARADNGNAAHGGALCRPVRSCTSAASASMEKL